MKFTDEIHEEQPSGSGCPSQDMDILLSLLWQSLLVKNYTSILQEIFYRESHIFENV
jgi:hypothetical protein